MSTTYTPINADEFEQFLTTYAGEDNVRMVPQSELRFTTKERVYDVNIGDDNVVVRVFSSIDVRSGNSRDAGADAIRTTAYSYYDDRILTGEKRTHRIETWRKNLAKKLDALGERIPELGEDVRERMAEDAAAAAAAHDAVDSKVVPDASLTDADVCVTETFESNFGLKAALSSPYAAKDAIKALDWEDTHRAWSQDKKAWTVDADAIDSVLDSLEDAGFSVERNGASIEDVRPDTRALGATMTEGDRVTVTYTSKVNGKTMEHSGDVAENAGEHAHFRFVRDDGQMMYVTDEGLFTAMSAHPYVGRVEDVLVE